MTSMSKSFKNDDGTEETIIMNSEDDYELNMRGSYCLANHKEVKKSRLAKKFEGSILGSDIGFKSGGFTSVAILASVIAVAVITILYFLWRF